MDVLTALVFVAACMVVVSVDGSWLYHSVRGQTTLKLYVIFNVLEVASSPAPLWCGQPPGRTLRLLTVARSARFSVRLRYIPWPRASVVLPVCVGPRWQTGCLARWGTTLSAHCQCMRVGARAARADPCAEAFPVRPSWCFT